MYIPNTTWTWSFLIVTIVQAAIGLALEGYIFAKFQTSLRDNGEHTNQAHAITAYLSLFIFGYLYELYLAWDALRRKNTIQVIGLCAYNLGLMIYAAVQMDQIRDAVTSLGGEVLPDLYNDEKPLLVAVPCVLALGSIIMGFITWKLYDEFAWTIYKNISADVRMKRRYLAYQVYVTLLKFDFFFFLSFSVQFLVVVVNTSDAEFYITIVAIPITIILLFLAAYWVRAESLIGMIFTIILYFAGMAYFLFKLVRMYDEADPHRVADYLPARRGLTLFAVITLLCLIVTIINAAVCASNFGKGLKPHIMSKKKPAPMNPEDKAYSYDGTSTYNSNVPLGQVQTRMTID